MKRTIIILLIALLLIGCSRETQVWLPEEEVVELQGKEVVRIPVSRETEPASTEAAEKPAEETEPASTQPVMTGKATISRKPTTTPKKNTSTGAAANKETITATGKPVSTEPPATEPAETESPATEPPATEPPLYDINDYRVGNLEYEMLDRINEHRAEAEREPFWMDEWLCAIASCRSYEASQVWSHTRPDGRHFATVLEDYGYSVAAVQELMVYDTGSGDGTAMADRWMEGNQRELLLGDYTTAGIGVYQADGITYVTCLIAK